MPKPKKTVKTGFKARLEYTPAPTIEKLRRRLGL